MSDDDVRFVVSGYIRIYDDTQKIFCPNKYLQLIL